MNLKDKFHSVFVDLFVRLIEGTTMIKFTICSSISNGIMVLIFLRCNAWVTWRKKSVLNHTISSVIKYSHVVLFYRSLVFEVQHTFRCNKLARLVLASIQASRTFLELLSLSPLHLIHSFFYWEDQIQSSNGSRGNFSILINMSWISQDVRRTS